MRLILELQASLPSDGGKVPGISVGTDYDGRSPAPGVAVTTFGPEHRDAARPRHRLGGSGIATGQREGDATSGDHVQVTSLAQPFSVGSS